MIDEATQERLAFLPRLEPEQVVEEAVRLHQPVHTVCLFSGGHDSTVLAHRCRDLYDSLAFIDTGTAIPGVRAFVESFASELGKPLRILDAGDAYRRLVLDRSSTGAEPLGFPGPGQHTRTYQRLKERQLDVLLRELKEGRPRVLFLGGIRRSESARRQHRTHIDRHRSMVFASPLIDWTRQQMLAYRLEHRLPESDVAALLHRSGECNCGCFGDEGERRELEQLWPEWFEATIASLEREAAARGVRSCRWAPGRDLDRLEPAGPLCSDCELRLELRLPLEVAN